MPPESLQPPVAHASERRPPVWPWLLMPLAALTLFFALQALKKASLHTVQPGVSVETGSSEGTGSH